MRTIQMTLDEDLIKIVDQMAKDLKVSRSAFTRDALREVVDRLKTCQLEEKHRQGYLKHPVTKREFGVWEAEQDWGDEW